MQALTYVKDLSALLKELHRVLKPGAKLSFLDWFMLEAYEDNNPEHRELLRKTKAIIGAVYTPRPEEYHAALEKAGYVAKPMCVHAKRSVTMGAWVHCMPDSTCS